MQPGAEDIVPMGAREEYKAKRAAEKAREEQKSEDEKRAAQAAAAARREAELAEKWFFDHPDRTVRYTGWLQLYTLALVLATVALVGAGVVTAVILHNTDEKIGGQLTQLTRQLNLMEADQRPWLFVPGTEIISPLHVAEMEATISLGFHPKNTGRTPGQFAYIDGEFFAIASDENIDTHWAPVMPSDKSLGLG